MPPKSSPSLPDYTCQLSDEEHGVLLSEVANIHETQELPERHKCILCAYLAGYEAGQTGAGELKTCKYGNAAPISVLEALRKNQGGVGRHKCAVCAYNLGVQAARDKHAPTVMEQQILEDIKNDSTIPETMRQQLVKSRIGQGQFRGTVLAREQYCRITKLSNKSLLVASHIKPWRSSTNEERLDGDNGLMLSPHVDRLFDRGYISFEDDGRVLVSEEAKVVLAQWGITLPTNVGEFRKGQKHYLEWHRQHLFKGGKNGST